MTKTASILGNLSLLSVLGAVAAFLVGLQLLAIIKFRIQFKRNGGIRAAPLTKYPFGSMIWLYRIGKAQLTNTMHAALSKVLEQTTPECPDVVEISVAGTNRILFTKSPAHIKALLTSKFSDYGKGPQFHRLFEPFMGESVFTTDGAAWQEARSLIRPMFVKSRISDLHCFERGIVAMMEQFPEDGVPFNIMDLLFRMTIDTTTDFLFGESIDSLATPENPFMEAFNELQRFQTTLTMLEPVEKFIPRGTYLKNIKVVDNFMDKFIDQALALPIDELQKINKSENSFTFLHALALHTRERKVIRDQINSVLLAGRDTTGATLSWTFFELMQKPRIWAKLREEILSVVGPEKMPSYEDLKAMKYLDHVIHEILRLYPAVPYNVRTALSNSSLPSSNPDYPDVTTMKGDQIFYSPYLMQRDPALFPPVSEKFPPVDVFAPERWEHWQPKPWHYVPFNGGPRICVGQQFAITEMAYTMTRLIQKYDRLVMVSDPTKQFMKVEIVGIPGDPIMVTMHKAKA